MRTSCVTAMMAEFFSRATRLSRSHDLHPTPGVERGGRLVGKDQRRLVGERAPNRHALLLAAGEVGRHIVGAVGDFEVVEQLPGAAARAAAVHAVELHGQGDVVQRREEGDQVVCLEDEPDVLAAEAAHVDADPAIAVDRLAIYLDQAGAGIDDQADAQEQRGLARTAGAEQRDQLAGLDIEIDTIQRCHRQLAGTEHLPEPPHAQYRHVSPPAPATAACAAPARCRAGSPAGRRRRPPRR
jgi:hypothetical protein